MSKRKRERVYERDGWRCWLCGEPVEREEASLDHVVRHRSGGTNDIENLRLDHKRCNNARERVAPAPTPIEEFYEGTSGVGWPD